MILTTMRRLMKNKSFMAFLIIMPIAMFLIFLGIDIIFNKEQLNNDENENSFNFAFISEDKGKLSEKLYKKEQLYTDKESALEEVKKGNSVGVVEIPEDFSEKIEKGIMPDIKVYQDTDSAGVEVQQLSGIVQTMLVDNFLEKENIKLNIKENDSVYIKDEDEFDFFYFIAMFMAVYFLLLSSGAIAEDLFMLKDKGILKRNLLSPHKERNVTLSVVMTYFIMQTAFYLLITSIFFPVFNKGINEYFMLIIAVTLSALQSLALSIFFARLVKKERLVSSISSMTVMIMFFQTLFMYSMPNTDLAKMGKFSFVTYIMEIIAKGEIFPNALISLLISGVLLTFGSLKIKDFANS